MWIVPAVETRRRLAFFIKGGGIALVLALFEETCTKKAHGWVYAAPLRCLIRFDVDVWVALLTAVSFVRFVYTSVDSLALRLLSIV